MKCVLIVIRSCGERTTEACRKLVLYQGIPPEQVVIVQEAPFTRALKRSFELGIERNLRWTLCVDADVLLRPGAIHQMLSLAEEQPDNVCETQGQMLDKLFATVRPGGVHLYRTSLLPQALALIPGEGENIRPEHGTLQRMKALGYPWVEVPYVVGLHDYEQYHRDIYRKCFVQAHKHAYHADKLLTIWRDGANEDPDFRTALIGFAAGIQHLGTVSIDVRQDLYRQGFEATGIAEKPPLASDGVSSERVEATIATWTEPEVWRRARVEVNSSHPAPTPPPVLERLKNRVRAMGAGWAALYYAGWVLGAPGDLLQKIALKFGLNEGR